ncbi:MAG: hypothetical protein HRT58_11870 [Crocinitomicaceae bacterium]|nr:hypothetical protein [Flavobacteriales bacterium]NQZ36357.1 hypothetical protein [Crocinitomicaceae bacterium]
MIKKAVFTLILLALLFSCKKHRLKNEKAILEGTWEWHFSVRRTSLTTPPFLTFTDTIFPSDVSSSYGITFLKKGKVQLFENNELINEDRTVFEKFQSEPDCPIKNDPYYFDIYLDNDSDDLMFGCVNPDTLMLAHSPSFPFPDATYSNSTEDYTDYFKKVE